MSRTKYQNRAWLRNYKLENWNSILDQEGEFKPGLNVVIGKNGAGKTNILSYLSRVFEGETYFYSSERFDLEFEICGEKPFSIPLKWEEGKYIGKSPESAVSKLSETKIQNIVEFRFIPQKYPAKLPMITDAIEFETANSSGAYIEILTSNVPWFIKTVFSNLILNASALTRNEANEKGIEDFLRSAIKEKILSNLKIVEEYSPIESIRLSEKFMVREGGLKNSFSVSGLVLEFKVDGKWFGFKQLSDGTQRIFLLIAELELAHSATERKTLRDPLPEGVPETIFLVEEPELGIHPHQLHRIMEYLKERSKYSQIILSTHSPQVLNFLDQDELDRLLICSISPEEGTQIRNLTKKEIDEAVQYMGDNELFLSDYWVHSNLEPDF